MENLPIAQRYSKERYRKFAEYVRLDKYSVLWPDCARYVARLNNNPANPPVEVSLVRNWSDIPPQAPDGSYHPGLWFRYEFFHFVCNRAICNESSDQRVEGVLLQTSIAHADRAVPDSLRCFGDGRSDSAERRPACVVRPRGWISPQTMHILEPGTRINLFSLMPQTDFAVKTFFWVFLAFSALLTIGLFTRLSSIAVFVCLCSIHERLTVITNSGDTLMRVIGFFLMFAPAGAAFSVDRLIRIWQGKEGLEIRPRSPWAQRMIQYQVALLYFVAFWWKSAGETWVNGTALYYVYHLDQFRRFPIPDFLETPIMMRIGSWATLIIDSGHGLETVSRRG